MTSCDVWWASTSTDPGLLEMLTLDEPRRASKLRLPADRARFVTARAVVRSVLASRLGLALAEILLDRTCHRCGAAHGKPCLHPARQHAGIEFSIARAGSRVLVAVTDGAPVGVDLQSVVDFGRRDLDAVASEILTATERASYRALPAGERLSALSAWWTRKEAALKAIGEGLSVSPSSLRVTDPGEPPAILDWSQEFRWPTGEPDQLFMWNTFPAPTVVAALAVLTRLPVALRQLDGDALLATRFDESSRKALTHA
jgi:4'-phosphopantetheinyl transferase